MVPQDEREGVDLPRVEMDPEECKGCRYCVEACPVEVLSVSDEFNHRGFHYAVYAGKGCTGCAVCFYACPEPGAITVYKKERGGAAKSGPGVGAEEKSDAGAAAKR